MYHAIRSEHQHPLGSCVVCCYADCSICSTDYTMAMAFTCTKCMDSDGSAAIISVIAVLVLGAIIVLYMHLVSGEMDGAREGIIHRVTKRLPVQSIKIIVVVWQILTQVGF